MYQCDISNLFERKMLNLSLIKLYKEIRGLPSPAYELITELIVLTGRKECTVRKWLDGSIIPPQCVRDEIQKEMNLSFNELINEYYNRVNKKPYATQFIEYLMSITGKSLPSIKRYLLGTANPDISTKKLISNALETPIEILFPQ